MLIGINDIGRGATTESIVAGISKIIDKTQYQSPNTKIYLQSILPLNNSFGMFDGHTKHWKEINPLNKRLENLAKLKQATYINLYSELVTPYGDKLNNSTYSAKL